jgi:UDP-N-acetylglucosamine acyltransferase
MEQQETLQLAHPAARVHGGAVIHATAEIAAFTLIGDGVQIGRDCRIGPQCDLGDWRKAAPVGNPTRISVGQGVEIGARVGIHGTVQLGDNVRIGSNVTLQGPLQIGDRTEIFDGAVIGASGQFPGRHVTGGSVVIESDVTIREFVAINQPLDSALTRIGRLSYLMARSQVDHDCVLGEHVKLATGVTLGGAVRIDDYAYLGMNCVVHQGLHVGAHTMLGMNSAILKNVPPFAVIIGTCFAKINSVGLSRRGFTHQAIEEIEAFYAADQSIDIALGTRRSLKSDIKMIIDFYSHNAGKPLFSPTFLSKGK